MTSLSIWYGLIEADKSPCSQQAYLLVVSSAEAFDFGRIAQFRALGSVGFEGLQALCIHIASGHWGRANGAEIGGSTKRVSLATHRHWLWAKGELVGTACCDSAAHLDLLVGLIESTLLGRHPRLLVH